MAGPDTKLSPGNVWLAMPAESQLMFLEGLIQGLNQGVRYAGNEMAFSLATRLTDPLSPENKLAVDSLRQQMKSWSKQGVTLFKYSKPVQEYARHLTAFYKAYPKYLKLAPGYLMVYMDDQHGMEPAELYNLHEHSLHGFKL